MWRSWLAHLLWEQGVPCSSHGTPTRKRVTISFKTFLVTLFLFNSIDELGGMSARLWGGTVDPTMLDSLAAERDLFQLCVFCQGTSRKRTNTCAIIAFLMGINYFSRTIRKNPIIRNIAHFITNYI